MLKDDKNKILFIIAIISFLTPFTSSSINLALPAMGAEFKASTFLLSWVVEAFVLTTAIFLLPLGRLADSTGRRRVFVTGVALFTACSLVIGLVPSIQALILVRILQGIASAMIFSNGIAILTLVFPPERRGWAIGISSGFVYAGLSMGPVLGGFLNYYCGWRSIFYFVGGLSVIALVMTIRYMRQEWKEGSIHDFDGKGALIYMLAMGSTLYGLSNVAAFREAVFILIGGLALSGWFIFYESRQASPLLPIGLFKSNRIFAMSNLAALINYSATFAVGFLLSIYLQAIIGLDSQYAGMLLLIQPLMMTLLSPKMGALSDRLEPSFLASLGMGVTTVGLVSLFGATQLKSLPIIMVSLGLVGIGFALFASPNNNAIMSAVDRSMYGTASAALATSRMTGQAFSLAIVTIILSLTGAGSSGLENKDGLYAGIGYALAVFAVLCAIGIIPSRARGKVDR